MKFYPLFVRLTGRPCVVIGGGEVGERKVQGLLSAGARVLVVSPDLTPDLRRLVDEAVIQHRPRGYRHGDLAGVFLAYAATDDAEVNAQIAAEAEAGGVLFNAVDQPAFCNFITPSIVERGDLVIATSTGGASPLMARRIREQLAQQFGAEYAEALRILRGVRERLAEKACPTEERLRLLAALLDSPLLELLRKGDGEGVRRLLAETLGAEYTGSLV